MNSTWTTEFKALASSRGLTPKAIAQLVHVSERNVYNWLNGINEPIYPAKIGIKILLSEPKTDATNGDENNNGPAV